jgi:hypothetical protein
MGGPASLHSKQTKYIPTIDRSFYLRGLECRIVEASDIKNFILPLTGNIVVDITYSPNYVATAVDKKA